MNDEQGSSGAGDARGPVQREVNQIGGPLDSDQTSGSTRQGPGGRHGFDSCCAHRCTVWAPFNERTHLHTRARPRGKEPPLLLTLRCLDASRQRTASEAFPPAATRAGAAGLPAVGRRADTRLLSHRAPLQSSSPAAVRVSTTWRPSRRHTTSPARRSTERWLLTPPGLQPVRRARVCVEPGRCSDRRGVARRRPISSSSAPSVGGLEPEVPDPGRLVGERGVPRRGDARPYRPGEHGGDEE
jgi:hypothetical protein